MFLVVLLLFQLTEDYGATPPPMSTPGSRAMSIGFTVMLLSISAGIHFGADGFSLLLSFMGVLAGTNLVTLGIRMADHPASTFPAVFGGARAPTAFVRSNTAAMGLVMASCAITVVSGESDPMLCFGMLAVLLLGVSLINIGARGE
jgi:hypothetical protein